MLDGPEEGLDSVSISCSDQELLCLVEKDAGKLSSEMMEEVEAVILVQSNGKLRVGSAAELVIGLGLEVFANLVVVVEFTIDNGVDGAVIVMKRLDAVGRKVIDS